MGEELLASSERFRELWGSGAVGEHQSERKMVRSGRWRRSGGSAP